MSVEDWHFDKREKYVQRPEELIKINYVHMHLDI